MARWRRGGPGQKPRSARIQLVELVESYQVLLLALVQITDPAAAWPGA
jgi:hypothetical protein